MKKTIKQKQANKLTIMKRDLKNSHSFLNDDH